MIVRLSDAPFPEKGGPLSGSEAAHFVRFLKSVEWKRNYVEILGKTVGAHNLDPTSLDRAFLQLKRHGSWFTTTMRQTCLQRISL